ncbi:uncharacterized protein PFL1_05989 [Pseudozyma flocculosa PF-1]|uniref:Fe2OG dioxygenase domain-containing protein n=2 Tax=Pseudozyma flocculosa TaxID=84751 RepID=A0A5C3F3J2_9BASI|nr:uncharacterized protein PFL1_05989 [Pseudozyma flocculosa PF-1]EPQ26341.1 hypothetical protein PFL1_05989 [Pseudozyma flocculosa PF-1]SPO39074.1 uncharacterized protein PSFLO_04553 [Pseudozyma flocculosa]
MSSSELSYESSDYGDGDYDTWPTDNNVPDFKWAHFPILEDDVPAKNFGEQQGPLHDVGKLLAEGPQEQQNLDKFTFGGPADLLPPLPGLSVEGYGPVALPIVRPAEAKKLAAKCQKAPFGRGRDTLFDASVRKTWQLEPEKVTIANQAWHDGIAALGSLIARKMGFPGTPVTLHLYKLLLYDVGGHFGRHRDTEKEDGMFATLVVQLPSNHTGGQMVVYKGGASVTHDFGAAAGTAAFKCHYAVHYADAEHEITPVTEGHRLALVYSVCWPADRDRSSIPSSVDAEVRAKMASALRQMSGQERRFYLPLDHEYTPKSIAGLGDRAFKGVDRDRLVSLRAANALLPEDRRYAFFIAKAERRQLFWKHCERKAWEEYERPRIAFKQLQDLDGGRIIQGSCSPASYFGAHDILNPDAKSLLKLWQGHRTKQSEDTGNEGPAVETTYTKYVLLAWPARLVRGLEVICAGEDETLSALLARGASDAELADFLRVVEHFYAALVRPAGVTVGKEKLRHAIFKALWARPFNRQLLDLYLAIFSTAKLLLHSDRGWNDFMRLTQWQQAWPAVGNRVLDILADDPNVVLRAIRAQRDRAPEETIHILVEALLRKEHGLGSSANDLDWLEWLNWDETAMWQVAVSIPGSAVCRNIVQRHLNAADDRFEIGPCLAALRNCRRKQPQQFEACREAIRPLVERCIAQLQGQRAQASQARPAQDYWRFAATRFHGDARVRDFLRGPERTTTISGFDGSQAARYFVEDCQVRMRPSAAVDAQKWKRHGEPDFTFTAAKEGRGREATVTLTKTDLYPQQRELKRLDKVKHLDESLAEWGSLLDPVTSAATTSTDEALTDRDADADLEAVYEDEDEDADGGDQPPRGRSTVGHDSRPDADDPLPTPSQLGREREHSDEDRQGKRIRADPEAE